MSPINPKQSPICLWEKTTALSPISISYLRILTVKLARLTENQIILNMYKIYIFLAPLSCCRNSLNGTSSLHSLLVISFYDWGMPHWTNIAVFSCPSSYILTYGTDSVSEWLGNDYQFGRSTNDWPLPDFPHETSQVLRTNYQPFQDFQWAAITWLSSRNLWSLENKWAAVSGFPRYFLWQCAYCRIAFLE